MAIKPRKPCHVPGCKELTAGKYCVKHEGMDKQRRKQPFLHLYGNEWKKLRLHKLKEQPLCVECMKVGKVTLASVLDHIIAHKGDLSLFWDDNNLQPLCSFHHNAKTAKEDGGFGNKTI